jgi:hypothetical protein
VLAAVPFRKRISMATMKKKPVAKKKAGAKKAKPKKKARK